MQAPAHELSRYIQIINVLAREASEQSDSLAAALWTVLDELIEAYNRVPRGQPESTSHHSSTLTVWQMPYSDMRPSDRPGASVRSSLPYCLTLPATCTSANTT